MGKLSRVWENRVDKLVELLDLNNGTLPKSLAFRCFLSGYTNQLKRQMFFNTTLKIATERNLITTDKNMLILTGEVNG